MQTNLTRHSKHKLLKATILMGKKRGMTGYSFAPGRYWSVEP